MQGERERGALLQGLFGILSQSQTDVCKNLNCSTTVLNPGSCAQRATALGEKSTALTSRDWSSINQTSRELLKPSHSNLAFMAEETAETRKVKRLFQLHGENLHSDGD